MYVDKILTGEVEGHFKCPFCNFKSDTMRGLIIHASRVHNDVCPVCGEDKNGKSVEHHVAMKARFNNQDKLHKVAYPLLVSKATKSGQTKDLWYKCYRKAVEHCFVKD